MARTQEIAVPDTLPTVILIHHKTKTAHTSTRQFETNQNRDELLKTELENWRNSTAKRLYRNNFFFGGSAVMPDDILQTILEISQYRQLSNLSQLRDLVGWHQDYVKFHGPEVLQVISAVFTAFPPQSTNLNCTSGSP